MQLGLTMYIGALFNNYFFIFQTEKHLGNRFHWRVNGFKGNTLKAAQGHSTPLIKKKNGKKLGP